MKYNFSKENFKKQSKLIILNKIFYLQFFYIFLVFNISESMATDLTELNNKQAHANNDFYNSLRKMNNPSQEQINALRNKKLDPTRMEIALKSNELRKNFVFSVKQIITDTLDKKFPSDTSSSQAKPSSSQIRPVRPFLPSQRLEEEPERILDGSNIPKEIEFPGKINSIE